MSTIDKFNPSFICEQIIEKYKDAEDEDLKDVMRLIIKLKSIMEKVIDSFLVDKAKDKKYKGEIETRKQMESRFDPLLEQILPSQRANEAQILSEDLRVVGLIRLHSLLRSGLGVLNPNTFFLFRTAKLNSVVSKRDADLILFFLFIILVVFIHKAIYFTILILITNLVQHALIITLSKLICVQIANANTRLIIISIMIRIINTTLRPAVHNRLKLCTNPLILTHGQILQCVLGQFVNNAHHGAFLGELLID